MKTPLLSIMLAVISATAHAEGLALTGKVGSLGLGLELTKSYSDVFTSRLGFNAFNFSTNTTQGTVNYDVKLKLQSLSALADWYPMQGGVRATGGLFYNNNKLSLNAIPTTPGVYSINGTPYALNSLQSEVTFNTVAPYLGVGWGNPAAHGKGWGLTSDFGVLLQGTPKVGMSATGPGAAAAQPAIDSERMRLQDSLRNFKLYPVATMGISYQW